MLEDIRALLRIELLQDVGDVGGVQLVEALVRDGQLHFREVSVEQIHVVPGDDALVDLLVEGFRDGDDGALEPGGKPSQNAANAHFGAEQSQLCARLRKLEVVYAHDLKPLGVDDLAIHEVAREKHLVGLQVAEADVGRIDGKLDALAVELVDVLSPGNHEGDFARPLEGEACDARKDLAG